MTAVVGTQVIGVSAAPNNVTAVSKEALMNFYEENFDVEAYKEAYPDLVAAFGDDEAAYLNHYLEFGMAEGRSAGGFDAIAFIINNYDYFAEHGLHANFPFFNVEKYKAANPDLKEAFGDDLALYLNHYLNFGIFENRSSCGEIDIVAFAKENPGTMLRSDVNLAELQNINVVTNAIKREQNAISTASESDEVEIVEAGNDVVILDKENKVYYNVSAYNAAKEAWINSQPDVNDYLEETGYFEAYDAWLESEPNIADYLEGEAAETYQAWLDAEPDYVEYLFSTEYKEIYDEWNEGIPQIEDYTVGYTSQEAANAALAEDHAEWEANAPKKSDYPDVQAYANAMTAYVAEYPEPLAEDYPYFEDGYTDEDVAQAAYETAHSTWESGKPVAETEEELQAKIDAYIAENAEPLAENYTSKVNTYESADAAQTAYNNALSTWETNKATALEGLEEGTEEYNTALENFLADNAEPTEADYVYFEDGYASEEEATNAYNEAHSAWESGKPVAETEEEYQARVNEYVSNNAEPVVEDYTSKVNTYESQDEATAAFEADYAEWAANKPKEEDFVDEASYNNALEEYKEENPEPTINDEAYALGDYATEEEANEAFTADREAYFDTCPDETPYIEKTTYDEDYADWEASEPDVSEGLKEVDGVTYEDAVTSWEESEPNADEYLEDTTYDDDYAAWEEEQPVLEDFPA